ncbi:hypothetical protein BDW02DRAFT_618345 [Decorospora gaudefroyi]|uniref:BTB domain-containing protein n=1 Tax=Decorospora gaudefroyi TaxID=184978 RepID=A0A6A5KHU4_9PLEO|nr:hypothetical protein BDW02DRAFT_618345 [Decorospora gaudefroyi]
MATPEKSTEDEEVYVPLAPPECSHASEPLSPTENGNIVTVVVGTEFMGQRTFLVHDWLLIHYSAYFRNVLEARSGTGENVVELSGDSPKIFAAFYHFLYARTLFSRLDFENIPFEDSEICHIYVFGQDHGIPQLCNAAVDLLFVKNVQTWTSSTDQLHYIYEETQEHSPLRKYMVDWVIRFYPLHPLRENESSFPKDFLIDVIEAITAPDNKICSTTNITSREKVDSMKLDICSKYHDHSPPRDYAPPRDYGSFL